MLSTDEGRARFWAETAVEEDGYIEFQFVNDFEWRGKILDAVPGERFQVEYFGSITTFELESDGRGGTDLTSPMKACSRSIAPRSSPGGFPY